MANIRCDSCGYNNHEYLIKRYGVCKLCGKVLDSKAKYKHEMYKRLHLWSRKKTKNIVLKGVQNEKNNQYNFGGIGQNILEIK